MAASPTHKGWLYKHNEGLLAAVLNGAKSGASVLATNTALDGVLLGTPVTPALAVDSLVLSNLVASGDVLIAANNGGNSQAWLWVDASAGTMGLYGAGTAVAILSATALEVEDDILLALGNDQDQVFLNRTTILATNTALTGVMIGTPVTPAVAANSLIISNVTASGDILIAANLGGNSQAWLWIDSSAGTMTLYGAGTAAAIVSATAVEIEDNILLALGNDQDVVLVNRTTVLNANTALTGVLIGTPVTPAVAANSLILANATASGDILVAVNEGGNSQAYIWIDTSAAEMRLYGSGTLDAILTSGVVTIEDDVLLAVGTGSTARLSYDTTDANANALLLQLPAGGATDVPVIVIGQSVESVDLGLYNGVVDPRIAMFGVGAVATGPVIEFRKARGTVAAPTVVTTGDDVGSIRGYAAVAAGEYVQTAEIRLDCAGTIGTTQGPGTITFLTATDAAPSVLTQAMIISAAQKVTIASGESTGDFKLNLTLTAGADGVGADGEQLTSGGAAAECDWSAAGSLRQFKNILGRRTDAEAALRQMLQTPVYDFHYKRKSESAERIMSTGDVETVYTGIMGEDAPWAMHHKGRIVNPVNALGYTVLAFQAMAARLAVLEARLA